MPVNDHLKIASAEIMKAAELLRQEIGDLRHDADNLRQTIDRHVAQMMDEVRMREQEMSRGDGVDAPNIQSTIRGLQTQIAVKKKEHDDEQRRIEDMVRQKQGLITQLESQARSVSP